VVKFGLDYVLVLVASISLSLAVINALPLPALDGGRLFILVLRRIGLPISEKHEGWVHLAGFALLILFGIIIAISDVLRFF
jgi:regulator of sigma E protease